jgi:hypothetical protein
LRLLHERYHDRFEEARPGEARLVLKEGGNLCSHIAFSQTVVLLEIGMDAKAIAIDVDDNVIVYGNSDFVERFETNEGGYKETLLPQTWKSIVKGS